MTMMMNLAGGGGDEIFLLFCMPSVLFSFSPPPSFGLIPLGYLIYTLKSNQTLVDEIMAFSLTLPFS